MSWSRAGSASGGRFGTSSTAQPADSKRRAASRSAAATGACTVIPSG